MVARPAVSASTTARPGTTALTPPSSARWGYAGWWRRWRSRARSIRFASTPTPSKSWGRGCAAATWWYSITSRRTGRAGSRRWPRAAGRRSCGCRPTRPTSALSSSAGKRSRFPCAGPGRAPPTRSTMCWSRPSGGGATNSQPLTKITDYQGNYTFTNLPAGGSYTLTPKKDGYSFSPASKSFSNLNSSLTAANFSAVLRTYNVSGKVIQAGTTTGIGGVTMTITSPAPTGFASRTVITTSTGIYTFTDLPAGRNYTIKPTKTGFTFSPLTRSITNLSGNVLV